MVAHPSDPLPRRRKMATNTTAERELALKEVVYSYISLTQCPSDNLAASQAALFRDVRGATRGNLDALHSEQLWSRANYPRIQQRGLGRHGENLTSWQDHGQPQSLYPVPSHNLANERR